MDVDDSAVDLSVSRSLPPELSELRALTASGLTITPAQPPPHGATGKRVLRPRSEQRSYAESPDIVLLPAAPPHRKPLLPAPAPFTDVSSKLNSGAVNVSITASAVPTVLPAVESPRDPQDDEESDDENEPPLPIPGHRELSSAEIWERERSLRALREKLRAEETRLVLLRKLRQSQQAATLPPAKDASAAAAAGTALAGSGCVVPPGVTVTPAPPPAHQHAKRSGSVAGSLAAGNAARRTASLPGGATLTPGSYRTQRSGSVAGSLAAGNAARRTASLPGGATLTPGSYRTQTMSGGGASITPSVTITPAPPPTNHVAPKMTLSRSTSRNSAAPTPPAPPAAKPAPPANSSRNLSSTEAMRGHHSERARDSEPPAKKAGKNSGGSAAMAAEMQRVAEAQRQYLLDMIPGQHTRNPWTKN
ncbi:jg25525 [Pararge aegeria aegeria]|uniref:Jg25525 protein n=1 Tax=Pararge aegeria aegeria TaxID=348720 RepID=A0A8S4S0V9_9NEOP|nr:jg25525 [Pararge aegeria aegeria]